MLKDTAFLFEEMWPGKRIRSARTGGWDVSLLSDWYKDHIWANRTQWTALPMSIVPDTSRAGKIVKPFLELAFSVVRNIYSKLTNTNGELKFPRCWRLLLRTRSAFKSVAAFARRFHAALVKRQRRSEHQHEGWCTLPYSQNHCRTSSHWHDARHVLLIQKLNIIFGGTIRRWLEGNNKRLLNAKPTQIFASVKRLDTRVCNTINL